MAEHNHIKLLVDGECHDPFNTAHRYGLISGGENLLQSFQEKRISTTLDTYRR
jgi:hypothetical protein